jgi:hypothetical protein
MVRASRGRFSYFVPTPLCYTRQCMGQQGSGRIRIQDGVETLRRQGLTYSQIAKSLGLSKMSVEKAIHRLLKSGKIAYRLETKHPCTYTINTAFFADWSSGLAYFLGLFASDGSMSYHNGYKVSIELAARPDERAILHTLATCIGTPRLYEREGKSRLVKLMMTRKAVYETMLHFGFTPNKTTTLRFPRVPDKFTNHFLRGFLDGDGSIMVDGSNRLRVCFEGASLAFLVTLRDKLTAMTGLPGNPLHSKRLPSGRSFYRLEYTNTTAFRLCRFLYTDAGDLFLRRKRAVYEQWHARQSSFA